MTEKRLVSTSLLAAALLPLSLLSWAGPYSALEKCYNNNGGEVVKVDKGDTSTVRYKEPADLNAECNAKVIRRAKTEKNPAKLKELAGVIGRNSNWAAAVPVYLISAKADPKKAICSDKDAGYALSIALARSEEDAQAKDGDKLMAACWPQIKPLVADLLTPDVNGYVRDNVCKFLAQHGGVPEAQKAACAPQQ